MFHQKSFLKCLYSLPLLKDGYQQNYKRGAGQGPRGVSRSAQAMRSWNGLFKMTVTEKNFAPHWKNLKFMNAFSPVHVCSDFFVPYQWYIFTLSLQSKWRELWYLEIINLLKLKTQGKLWTRSLVHTSRVYQQSCKLERFHKLYIYKYIFFINKCTCHCWSKLWEFLSPFCGSFVILVQRRRKNFFCFNKLPFPCL